MALRGLLAPAEAVAGTAFEVPPALRHQVDFWKDVFATYSKRHVVIHDTDRLDRIYSVLDFRDLDERGLGEIEIERVMKVTVEKEKERVRRLLVRLNDGDTALTPDEERIRDLFRDDPSPRKFLAAAAPDRIRSQTGLKERFARGIAIGHRYFPEMDAIFRQEGIPIAITRLPLVESCFNVRAYSKVGAAGVWQFMPRTARDFLRIDEAIDERLDPIVSTRAAARFLRQNYERLGTWPLAIMAYNHGPGGIARAVRQLGTTDPTAIIERYDGPAFKFASRNFYPEFLAALEVERNYDDYFGPLPLDPPLRADVVQLPHYVSLRTVGRCAGGVEQIEDLNPGLLPAVHAGKQYIPQRVSAAPAGGPAGEVRALLRAGAGPFEVCAAEAAVRDPPRASRADSRADRSPLRVVRRGVAEAQRVAQQGRDPHRTGAPHSERLTRQVGIFSRSARIIELFRRSPS